MTWFLPGFMFVLLTARFFSETLQVTPKAVDLVDLAVIPALTIAAVFGTSRQGADLVVDRRILVGTVSFAVIAILSAAVNAQRTSWPPVSLYVFGMLEGPILFMSLNRIVKQKAKVADRLRRSIVPLFLLEAAVLIFVNLPTFVSSGNPDVMSGTFGLNSYQFSFLLIVFGGYFVGRMRVDRKSYVVASLAIGGIFLAFLLLQYRTGAPAFFLSFAVVLGVLFGGRFMRLALAAAIVGGLGVYAFQTVLSSNLDLKFEDLGDLASNPTMVSEFGKVIAHENVLKMYREMPHTMVFGAGPGTMVSRAAVTFIVEPQVEKEKGVGGMVTTAFPGENFQTDVFLEYISPLYGMVAFFGSDQTNSPSSSILAAAAETGMIGLVLLVLVYGTLVRGSLRYARRAARAEDEELTPVSAALAAGALYLAFLAPIDNYLEVARVTLPIWTLFWIVSVLHRQRRIETVESMLQQTLGERSVSGALIERAP